MTFLVTSIGGQVSPWASNACSSAVRIVAPLSTKVPSQSKIASLFTPRHLLDRLDDVVSFCGALAFDRCRQIVGRLVLVELAGAADVNWIDLEPDDRLGHRLELAGFHLGSGPWLFR